jgi:hypothetical protein
MISAGVASLALLASVDVAAQQGRSEDDAAQGGAKAEATVDRAIFARFSDLDALKTKEQLAAFQRSKEQTAILETLVKGLETSAPSVEIERASLLLVAKLKEDEANVVLAAVMRHYYHTFVRAKLESGALKQNEAFERMIKVDEALTTATFGVQQRPATGAGPIGKARVTRR